jgi:hypothetical protein
VHTQQWSAAQWIGEGPAVGVDDCGGPEFDASAVDGDIPALQVHLLMVHGGLFTAHETKVEIGVST